MAVEDPVRTSDRLSFLLARQGQCVHLLLRRSLATSGLGPRHGQALARLGEQGRMSQQALIEALNVDPSILVVILNDLEREGLAERRRDPSDRRRHIVEMSPKGAAMLKEMDQAVAGIDEEVFADLDDLERAQLASLLSRVRGTPDEAPCGAE